MTTYSHLSLIQCNHYQGQCASPKTACAQIEKWSYDSCIDGNYRFKPVCPMRILHPWKLKVMKWG